MEESYAQQKGKAQDDERVQKAARVIAEAHHVVAFTGAGISAESGVPTFRGDSGIWQRYDPMVLDIRFFQQNPAESWRAIRDIFYETAAEVTPNPGHQVLADWEKRGILQHCITQNIDDLHYRAGSRSISEYHGNIRKLRCRKTGRTIPFTPEVFNLERCPDGVPRSPWGGILKPDFIFFGEGIPQEAAERADAEARACDVMLVIGSTGEVQPAAQLPHIASKGGAWIIEINPHRSNFTSWITDIYLPYESGTVLPLLDRYIHRTP
ncbi:MAG: SIR2 family NAD-dependent protein deacylase [Spirochaeta sp.]